MGHFYLSGSAVVGQWVVFTGEGLLLWVSFAGEGLLLLVRESFLMDRVSCYGSLGRFYLSASAVVGLFAGEGLLLWVSGQWVIFTGVGLLYWFCG